jgi:hypothetical protein
VNDFETSLKTLLDEHVDERTGPRRAAPPVNADASLPVKGGSTARGHRRFVVILASAACVAAVAVGTVAATRSLAGHHSTPRIPTGQTATNTAGPTATKTVSLGGARISLPIGWVARNLHRYEANGSSFAFPGWCLTPASVPVSTAGTDSACPVFLEAAGAATSLDVDIQGGQASNPEYCLQGQQLRSESEQTGDRPFGGRPAEWRLWNIRCRSGQGYQIEQYVVPTASSYILYSSQPTGRYHSAITEIAASSTLPAATRSVRLMDRGYLRSVTKTTGGYRITLDRAVAAYPKVVNPDPTTYAYFVPTSVFAQGGFNGTLGVGKLVYLSSNGRQVQQIYGT